MQSALVRVSCSYPGSLYNAITIGSAYDLMPKEPRQQIANVHGCLIYIGKCCCASVHDSHCSCICFGSLGGTMICCIYVILSHKQMQSAFVKVSATVALFDRASCPMQ
jgi:hypothetical protein